MNLKQKTIYDLKKIMQTDYGIVLSDHEIQELGISLLRITKIAKEVFNRTETKKQKISCEA